MATKDPQLDALTKKSESLLGGLKSTTNFGQGEPTSSSVIQQQQLLKVNDQIKALKDQKLREAWYGTKKEGVEEKPEAPRAGLMSKAVDFISRPLYGVAGATEYALGKSKASSLGEAIQKNYQTDKRTFGDILKESPLPGVAAAPLGFMLDVAFDPVNWATLGTTALVPRVFAGGVKAGMKGGIAAGIKAAAKGAESRVLEGAVTAGKLHSLWSLGSKGTKEAVEETGKKAAAKSWIKKEASASRKEYNALTGNDILADISSAGKLGSKNSPYRMQIGDLMRAAADSEVGMKINANKWFKYFDMDNAEWTRLANIKDTLLKTVGSEEEVKRAIKTRDMMIKSGMSFEEATKEVIEREATRGMKLLEEAPPVKEDLFTMDTLENPERIQELAQRDARLQPMANDVSDVKDILKNPDIYTTSDQFENGLRLAEESTGQKVTLDDLRDIIGRRDLDETGWTWFDDQKRKLTTFKITVKGKEREVGKSIGEALDAYQGFITMFKLGKVAASPTSWINAVVGNPTMAWMAGVNIMDPQYMAHINKARQVVSGSNGGAAWLRDLLSSTDILKTLEDNPTLFQKTTGLSYKELMAKNVLNQALSTAKEAGLAYDGMTVADLAKAIREPVEELTGALGELGVKNKNAQALMVGESGKLLREAKPMTETQRLSKKLAEGVEINPLDLPSSFAANEWLGSNKATQWLKSMEKGAEEGKLGYKILNLTYNKMASGYEKIDQSYKLGTMTYLTDLGVTEKELKVIARNIKLDADDLIRTEVDGVERFKLNGTKALELANEIYLNYAAMPAAVKVLKNLPLIGSPFASFSYGMGLKTAKTAVYNPAFFSKANSAMHDFSGEKSPLEKAALKNPMYSYLNQPTMFKLPGFTDSPFTEKNSLYLNLAGMLPYYSFNLFTPSARSYEDLYSDRVVNVIDNSPFLKDPVMSTIFDYLIQPMILKDNIQPQGSFGSPLYRSDASTLSKAGSFARSIAETQTPGIWAAPLGVGARGLETMGLTGITSALPSYRGQQLSHAMVGENKQGISGKEAPGSRIARSAANIAGIPLQTPVQFTNLTETIKKNLKK